MLLRLLLFLQQRLPNVAGEREQVDAPINPMQDFLVLAVAVPLLVLALLAYVAHKRRSSRR